MSGPDLVIFDCDGVLVDSEMIACRVDAECFAEIGLPVSVEDVRERYVGLSARAMFADIEARYGRRLPPDFAHQVRSRIMAAFDGELKPMAGIEAVLDALPCRFCVASSSAPDRLRHSLSVTGLLKRCEPHLFSATQVANGKPAPDLFLYVARQMGVPAAHCVVIEDSVAGIEAAVAADMQAVGFAGGCHCGPRHSSRLRAAGAVAVFADMRNFPQLCG